MRVQLIHLGSAKVLTQTGGGGVDYEDNFILRYDQA